MRHALLIAATLLASPAFAATCHTEKLTCGTTMPLGGYCECTAHGMTESGSVVTAAARRSKIDATAAGCGAHPDAPGCR